jgi:proteasome lid subunit RPN8/RPN11
VEKPLFINRSVIDSILSYAKACFPRESILLLRGKADKKRIIVTEVELPPLAVHGHNFANFPIYRLPIDFSIIGTAHSHPSGGLRPSTGDLNNFYGKIMAITAFPYETERDMIVVNREGNLVKYEIVEDSEESSQKW